MVEETQKDEDFSRRLKAEKPLGVGAVAGGDHPFQFLLVCVDRHPRKLVSGRAGHYFFALNALHAVFYGWNDNAAEKLATALASAERAASLDGNDAAGHSILGVVCLFLGQVERSHEEHLRAIELDPSFALAYWGRGLSLVSSGRPHDAIAMIQKAIRLSPADSLMNEFLADIALAQFQATQYGDAVSSARRSLQLSRGASAYRGSPAVVL